MHLVNAPTPLRFGVLGAARITSPALIEPARGEVHAVIAAIAARDRARAAILGQDHGIPRVHDGYAELLADTSIEAIYIALPNNLHAEWTLGALRAGKHVLCEKPIASNAEEAAVVANVARETGLVLAEAFHYRHHPLAHRVEALLRDGALGTIERVEGRYDVAIPPDDPVCWSWALSGGATMDLGCYPLQMIRWLGGDPVVIDAEAVTGPLGIDVSMVARLRLPNGGSAEMRCAIGGEITTLSTLAVRGSRRGSVRTQGSQTAAFLTVVPGHHAALTFSISSRHREMNTSRRAANDAAVLPILK